MTIFNPYEPHAIAFDIDGIFLDTATEMWAAFMKHYNLSWPISRWKSYYAEDILGKPKEEITMLYEPVLARDDMPALDGAPPVIDWLYHQSGYPVLFVTARRKQFCPPAEESIAKLLDEETEFNILCLDQISAHDRHDKLKFLLDNNVKLFFEDHSGYWKMYMDAGIQIGTFELPWTKQDIVSTKQAGYDLKVFSSWQDIQNFLWEIFATYHKIKLKEIQ